MPTQSGTVTGPVTWFISVGKIPGWEHEKFIQEYTVVHANMSRQVHKILPAFADYKQVIPDYDGDDETEQWLDSQLDTGKKLVEGDARLLRYRQYIDRTPADALDKFSGTLFANGRWHEFAAEEEYVFKNTQDAADFVNEHRQWIEAGQMPWIMTGTANVIWGKD
ncbi:hypothetical protein EDB80DRAFT_865413 [Ilyonectria destructans]|nr:hypothetical protein EDB80DRAFT_865413 [Ilyonectria destructans]